MRNETFAVKAGKNIFLHVVFVDKEENNLRNQL